ncbi:hypothetical protein BAUCODRAFT_62982 [Baudoinia panamericana UAMH 10762]|uniref:Zn(2)-C6 fungal-type domain-containing protein n=1 Tax=Baudoinia panamericana (strain UAMH 10762) TaxID=717646 RepID=M2N6F1_BAUPA|nr:uncharacterized protein BAUCODRAFT_62982 [Baudoinia panamericana UAMH 10762]EMC99648.1 hypothetical protein BAUCODRAFT_62982 [Baudoinia panamericana UAMH 10762]
MASPPGDEDGQDAPSHRACAHCRSQKVRCLPHETNADVCQRCARIGRPCIFTPLRKRKQRKRTDTRVAELEREMRAMRAMLKQRQDATIPRPSEKPQEALQGQRSEQSNPTATQTGSSIRWEQQIFMNRPSGDDATVHAETSSKKSTPLLPHEFPASTKAAVNDVVDRGLLSMATARQLYDTYRRDLFPHYPIIPLPAATTADDMRRSKPTLFLAIIAAAAGKDDSELAATLDKEILHAYATRSLMQSEKSLELVQALLISATWYHPPTKFGQLKYYEYMQMAANMAMDIGIGTRPVQYREDPSNPDLSMTPRSRDPSPRTGSLESRRTFLAVYMICAGVSLSLRRPNMLPVNSYVRECLEYLERSPDTVSTDGTLIVIAKLAMIAEDLTVSFCLTDPGGIASIADLRTQLMRKDFDKRLTAWYASVPQEICNGSAMIMYYTLRLHLQEVALHIEHSPDDFQAPYQMGTIQPLTTQDVPTEVLADAIAECITNAHALLNTFLAIDVDSLRASPVFNYVRVSFGAFILAKLCLSASSSTSRIGKVLVRSSLKVEGIMDRIILHVRSVVGPHRCRVPAIFLALLFKLRQWCLNPNMIETESGPSSNVGGQNRNVLRELARPPQAIAGARIIEQLSSSDASPETLNGGHRVAFESVVHPAATTSALAAASLLVPDLQGHSSGTPSISPDSVNLAPLDNDDVREDEMQLDNEIMNFIDSMKDYDFPEGGLTGLDDWIPDFTPNTQATELSHYVE